MSPRLRADTHSAAASDGSRAFLFPGISALSNCNLLFDGLFKNGNITDGHTR